MASALCLAAATAGAASAAAACGMAGAAAMASRSRGGPPAAGPQALPCPASEDALREVLEGAQVDTSAFGRGKAKTLPALLGELREGSCRLERDAASGKLRRRVEPVFVQLRHEGRVLVERSQVLPSGKRRERNSLLAEKLEPGDADPLATALRGLKEELGVELPPGLPEGLRHRPEEDSTETETMDSASYPGIQATYLTHCVCLELMPSSAASELFEARGLLTGASFETTEEKAEGTLRSTWEWVCIDDARSSKVKGLPVAQ